MNVEPVI